jgi:L-malate glycosyltransferase
MKILYIIDTLSLGGAQTVVKGIFENQRQNKNIFLFALRKTPVAVQIDHPNVFISKSSCRYSPIPFFGLRNFIRKNNIDILHCQLPRSQVFGYFLKKYIFRKVRLIIHEQGDIFEKSKILPFILKKISCKADLILACSEATKQMLVSKAHIDPQKICKLYNFVDTAVYNYSVVSALRKSERTALGIKEDCFVFGFAGRLIERKGWKDFITAAVFFKNNPQIKFLIAGSGKDEPKLKAMIRQYTLSETVIFPGYYSQMPKFYAAIDCLVIPSHWEPMGITEIEAMAAGVPVIASDVPGLNEIVSHYKNALLYNPGDVPALIKLMKMIHEDKELISNLLLNARAEQKTYSFETFLKNLQQFYT